MIVIALPAFGFLAAAFTPAAQKHFRSAVVGQPLVLRARRRGCGCLKNAGPLRAREMRTAC